MTNEVCYSVRFPSLQTIKSAIQKKGMGWILQLSAKHLIVRQTLECSHFITPQTRSSQRFPSSLILFFFPLLFARIRMLTLLLDFRVNIFHTNDLKATTSLQSVRNLDRRRRKYIACFYSTHAAITSHGSCDTKIIFWKHAPRWPQRNELEVK